MAFNIFSRHSRQILPSTVSYPKRSAYSLAKIIERNSKERTGEHIEVKGWVGALRSMKEYVFVDISDGSGPEFLQIVLRKSDKPDNLTYGCSVVAEGELGTTPNGKTELRAGTVSVVGECPLEGYPFAPRKQYSPDYVRQYPHLRTRTRSFLSLLRLRDRASTAIEEHLRGRGYVHVHTPILTSNDCEGAGEVFVAKPDSSAILRDMKKEDVPLDEAYFDMKAYLTVSGQLHLETAARGLSKVYTFGPTFRAENSKSRLHLSEFYMVEVEAAFVTDIEEVASEVESLVKAATRALLERCAADLRAVGVSEVPWLGKNFGFVTYDEAIDILNNHANQLLHPAKHGEALTKEHEFFLVQHNDGIPLFIVNWPTGSKPFYAKECVGDPSKVAAMDLLMPNVGELVGGSIREDDYDKLKLKLAHMPNLAWYLELRKYGNVPTAGFGMGFERFLQCVLGIGNIKDTIPFPRWPHNCSL